MFQAELHVALPRHVKTTAPRRVPATPTEAQVLAMPADQCMNAAQFAFFTLRVTELEAGLVNKARRADFEIATGAVVADPVDRASAEEEQRLALSTRARDAGQLLEVRVALARIAAGEFGYCSETGEPIGIPRLLIRPTTVLTTKAQHRQESMTRRFHT